jgi:hypothetical protein
MYFRLTLFLLVFAVSLQPGSAPGTINNCIKPVLRKAAEDVAVKHALGRYISSSNSILYAHNIILTEKTILKTKFKTKTHEFAGSTFKGFFESHRTEFDGKRFYLFIFFSKAAVNDPSMNAESYHIFVDACSGEIIYAGH